MEQAFTPPKRENKLFLEDCRPKTDADGENAVAHQALEGNAEQHRGQLRGSLGEKTNGNVEHQGGEQNRSGHLHADQPHGAGCMEQFAHECGGDGHTAYGHVVEAPRQPSQDPVMHIELQEEQNCEELVKHGEHRGIDIGVGINNVDQGKGKLEPRHLPGKLGAFQDELQTQANGQTQDGFAQGNL